MSAKAQGGEAFGFSIAAPDDTVLLDESMGRRRRRIWHLGMRLDAGAWVWRLGLEMSEGDCAYIRYQIHW